MTSTQSYAQLVGDAVAEAIEQAGLNVAQSADLFGMPRTSLRRKLSGDASFTVVELRRIAERLDLNGDVTRLLPPSAA